MALPGIAEQCQVWDLSGLTTWPQVQKSIRVVLRSRETRTVRRQLDGEIEELTSGWMWVTTLTSHRAPAATVIQLGHAGLLVLAMLAFNLFHAFYFRNLRPEFRKNPSLPHGARWMASQLYQDLPLCSARSF